MRHTKQKKGVTLLFAVIISSAALTVGLSVYSLLSSEIRLSALERDSVQALYAAHAGVECVMFWAEDLGYDAFSSTTPQPIQCDGVTINVGLSSEPKCENALGDPYPCDTDTSAGHGYVGYKLRDNATPEGHQFFPNTCTTLYVQPKSELIPFSLHSSGQTANCGSISPNTLQRSYEASF